MGYNKESFNTNEVLPEQHKLLHHIIFVSKWLLLLSSFIDSENLLITFKYTSSISLRKKETNYWMI